MLKPPCSEHIFRKSHEAQLYCLSTIPSLQFPFFMPPTNLLHFPPSTPSFLRQETCLELGLSVSSCLSALLMNYFPSTKLIISVTGDQPVSSTVLVQQALCTPLEKNGQMIKGEQRLKSDFSKSSF